MDEDEATDFVAMLNKDFSVDVAARVRLTSIKISDRELSSS
jgi:hypothetical protein